MQYRIAWENQDASEERVVVDGWEGVLAWVLGVVPPVVPFHLSITEFDPDGAKEGGKSSARELGLSGDR